jgi:CheY-like chemotaxis protein
VISPIILFHRDAAKGPTRSRDGGIAALSSAIRIAGGLDFDVLVSDIELPDGSGLELMWRLRAHRDVSAIALSGFGSSEDIDLSRSAGFAEHLIKPVDFGMLEEAIRRVAADTRAVGSIAR